MSANKGTRHRSFTSATAEGEEEALEPVTFDVDGETFTAKPDIQGIVLMDFLEASNGGGVESVVAFKQFLKDAMEEDEFKRYNTFLRESPKKIEITDIAQHVAYLVEAYSSRPTKASAQ